MGNNIRKVQNNRCVVSCEGSDEISFLEYLKSLYSIDSTNPKPLNGGGGAPLDTVKTIRNLDHNGAYAHRYAMVDSDRSQEKIDACKREAETAPLIELIFADSRFEDEMLKIYGASEKVLSKIRWNAEAAKREFSKICDRSSTGTDKSYDKVFPKDLLDKQRKNSLWLDSVIKIIEEANDEFIN